MNHLLQLNLDGNVSIAGDAKVMVRVTMGAAHAASFIGGTPNAVMVIGDMFVSGAVDCGNKGKLAARFGVLRMVVQNHLIFNILQRVRGHRLRYACIEGPEVGVYYRGRLKESNVIELPYYWKDLVDENSITVQLQPIGSNQNLVIQEFNNEFIVIAEDSTNTDLITDLSTIDCFYHVYGERKDINPLIVEYEGETWQDYPDPNFDPNKVDDDKRTYTDPQFAGPPNTFTA